MSQDIRACYSKHTGYLQKMINRSLKAENFDNK